MSVSRSCDSRNFWVSYPVSYPNSRPPEATKIPIIMAGADDPATLSGLRQPMAKAMADGLRPSSQGGCDESVKDGDDESLEESTSSIAVDHLRGARTAGGGDDVARQPVVQWCSGGGSGGGR